MTPKQYEQVVSQIAQSIYKRVEGIAPEQIKYGKRNRWRGVSGYAHQIDVSVCGPRNLILVECKLWRDRVSVHSVLAFFARIYDIRPTFHGQIHGVIVTTAGFQRGARKLAKHFGIDLQLVRSAEQFGFAYKNLLLVRPAAATAVASTADPTVVISQPKQDT